MPAKKKPVQRPKPKKSSASSSVSSVSLHTPPVVEKTVEQPPAAIPTVSMDAPLTVEHEIHGEEESVIPTVPANEPIPEAEVLASASDEPVLERKNKLLFTIGIILSLGIVVGSGILLVLSLRTPKQSSTPVPSTTPTNMVPTPTTTPQFVRSTVVVDVLNGSGVAGAAAKMATTLASRGYVIATIGNAATQATTTVSIAQGTMTVKDMLLADLTTALPTATYAGVLTEGTASARIILGKK